MRGLVVPVLVFFIASVAGIVAYSYSMRASPVLYRFSEKGDPVKEPVFSIFNPFRDREPENRAESFLTLLKDGKCEEATAILTFTPERRQEVCNQEANSPLLGWKLTNRTDNYDTTRMYYRARRKHYDGYQGQVWITVEKHGSYWQITKYECFY